jgi:hypothetical protein
VFKSRILRKNLREKKSMKNRSKKPLRNPYKRDGEMKLISSLTIKSTPNHDPFSPKRADATYSNQFF